MAGALQQVLERMFAALDRADPDGMVTEAHPDFQALDEISRNWIRGRDSVREYVRGMLGQVRDVRSELRDVQEETWGDAGVLTCWLEQDYTLEEERHHISAPTSVSFRREDGAWKMVAFHSAPLP